MTNSARHLLLAIESSCDETAVAIVDRDRNVLANVIASQDELHRRWGGVVPEVASRAHVENILPCLDEALKNSNRSLGEVAAVGVVTQPGLVGSLLVGLTAAKTLAWLLDVPLVAVNHIEAHLFACRWAADRDPFPAVGLVVSGGHTNLYDCRTTLDFELLGTTTDDAAGEAFDKAAAVLGLPYPGGPSLSKAALEGDSAAVKFPRTFLKEPRLEFSFSGMKTAMLYAAQGQPGSHTPPLPLTPKRIADLAASFQEAVVDVLVGKCEQALKHTGRKALCVGGGVAANARLRQRLEEMAARRKVDLWISPREFCTDNAAMAAIAWDLLEAGRVSPLDVDVLPGLVRKR
ncbi:MAG TPA: tRNA (adenosine(37)-N6)-threonylcarbamoyltransferase complex transferase subunit TsaD [Caulifigura sp.]|nr:tRNA (adenosine(37)-N6)-threonylcarbamoyltransferase complex transferase subunit TsaD [Caulifigura sp.]